eukprot:TRINITY_DN1748_c1_g4_i1.p2 TRINITY_DN1748_c1_g4~~TRINITY_DN1748_c1_g4_i1.p2  ORF type:complete len:218 (-),score=82.63 TRINITY_DN1748_c1_g4_i1:321-944(-)
MAVETWQDLKQEVTRPVQALLFIYFMMKLAQEIMVSESSLVSKYYFDWSIVQVGNFLGLLGLTVVPISTVVGNYVANIYEDRQVIVVTEIIVGVGAVCMFCLQPWVSYRTAQYVGAAVTIYVSSNVLEGVNMSLLSRVMSPALSRGTFNCGLLSTEAGTFARVVGDGLITLVGAWGTSHVLNFTLLPLLVTVIISVSWTLKQYHALF